MGYAKTTQNGRGIHLRLRARAFIISESPKAPSGTVIGEHDIEVDEPLVVKRDGDHDDKSMVNTMSSSLIIEEDLKEEEAEMEAERWWQLRHRKKGNQDGEESKDGNLSSNDVSILDPETTVCFVSMDIGMVCFMCCTSCSFFWCTGACPRPVNAGSQQGF